MNVCGLISSMGFRCVYANASMVDRTIGWQSVILQISELDVKVGIALIELPNEKKSTKCNFRIFHAQTPDIRHTKRRNTKPNVIKCRSSYMLAEGCKAGKWFQNDCWKHTQNQNQMWKKKKKQYHKYSFLMCRQKEAFELPQREMKHKIERARVRLRISLRAF